MGSKRQYINLVGSSSTPAKARRKKRLVKAKSRRGGKIGTVKGRGSARSTR